MNRGRCSALILAWLDRSLLPPRADYGDCRVFNQAARLHGHGDEATDLAPQAHRGVRCVPDRPAERQHQLQRHCLCILLGRWYLIEAMCFVRQAD